MDLNYGSKYDEDKTPRFHVTVKKMDGQGVGLGPMNLGAMQGWVETLIHSSNFSSNVLEFTVEQVMN